MAAASPSCGAPTAWVGVGAALRHSNPQCEGGMPWSLELRKDIGPDRPQAVDN